MWRCRLRSYFPPTPRSLCRFSTSAFHSRSTAGGSMSAPTAAEPAQELTAGTITWKDDIYGGALVDPCSGPSDPNEYSEALAEALKGWRQQGKRGIWLKLPKERAALVQCAVQQGFDFHHAEPGYVMLTQWLPTDEPCMLPPNASHQVGVGALVINEHGCMLAVQERNGVLKGRKVWKMPTGLVHAGEDLPEAAVREVLEETGIRATFDSILLVRQAHGFAFGKSDMFVLCALKPEPGQVEVKPQEEEIEAAAWVPLEHYTEQDTFQAELYQQLSAVCTAYAEGRYHGMQAAKLQASLPFSTRKRQDLLIWGQSLERMVQTASPHPGQAGGDGQRQPNSPTRQA